MKQPPERTETWIKLRGKVRKLGCCKLESEADNFDSVAVSRWPVQRGTHEHGNRYAFTEAVHFAVAAPWTAAAPDPFDP